MKVEVLFLADCGLLTLPNQTAPETSKHKVGTHKNTVPNVVIVGFK